MEKPMAYAYAGITEGMEIARDYVITPEVYEGFLAAFGDRSPIHVDAEFAQRRGFAQKVMHGTILNGFVSHFVGMVFPGEQSLLLSADLRYSKPCFLGDALTLRAKVSQKSDLHQVVVLNVEFFNAARQEKVASGRVQVNVK